MRWFGREPAAGFDTLLASARETYKRAFLGRVAELRRGGEPFAVELLVQPNGWTSPPPFNLMRVDFATGSADDPRLERLVDGADGAAPAREHTLESGLRVVAGTVGWEAFVVSFSSPRFRIEALAEWLARWLDVDDTRATDEHGLSGVVHGLVWDGDAERWRLTIDFGSAPVDAARELLDVLHANGVERCEVLPPGPGDG